MMIIIITLFLIATIPTLIVVSACFATTKRTPSPPLNRQRLPARRNSELNAA